MNHFPFFAPVSSNVIKAIVDLKKEQFAGAMPFVYFHEHNGLVTGEQITLGTEASYTFNPKLKYRFQPLITNLEVKPTGTMGVVREGSVTVKFASMDQMKDYQDFFRIGSAKTIVWGWNQNRLTGKDKPEIKIDDKLSKSIAGNIDKWLDFIKQHGLSADIMVGPLINFNFTLNNDASVDVVFTVGSPTEITAYLGSHKTDATSVKTGDKENVSAYKVANLLGLSDSEYTSILDSELKPNLLNYDYSQSSISQTWTNVLSSIGLQYDSISEDVFIAFNLIEKYAINQRSDGGKSGRYKLNLEDSITCAHPNMISNSENVIFLNTTMANPKVVGTETILDIANPQNIDHKRTIGQDSVKSYPEDGNGERTYKNEAGEEFKNTFKPRHWGKTRNILFKVSFVQDIIKNNGDGNIVNILEQLCSEINLATCGLTDVSPQTMSKEDGKEVFTIVDYALTPEGHNAPELPLFEAGDKSSTIINISFNCDLPKEIGAMAMLGNRKTIDSGTKLFFSYEKDAVLDVPTNANYTPISGSGGGGGGGGDGGGQPANYGKLQVGSQSPGELDNVSKKVIPNPTGLPGKDSLGKDKVWNYVYFGTAPGRWVAQQDKANTPAAKAATAVAMNVLINESCVLIKNEDTEHTHGKNNIGVTKVIFKNTDMIKKLYFGDTETNKNRPLLPIELELTVLGISGITCGQVLTINNLPFDNNGIFQVKEVNHTVNDTWETTIKLGFRPDN
jgi:hypothetical protein